MKFNTLEVSDQGDGLAMIRLAGPPGGANVLGLSTLRDLRSAAWQLQAGDGVKLLVFVGRGRAFSLGADLSELGDFGPEDILEFLHAGQALIRLVMDFDALTVAAVNGIALGGGLELALACDIRWAHRRAVFGLPESRLGLVPGWGGIPLLKRLVPESFWIEMVAGGECVAAGRAYEVGLVSRLFEGGDFEGAVLGELKKLAGRDGKVLREIKAQARRGRGAVEVSECDAAFLTLWDDRDRLEKPARLSSGEMPEVER